MYVCMYVCMYVHTYVRIYVRKYVRMYVCIYVCMYVCMYVYLCWGGFLTQSGGGVGIFQVICQFTQIFPEILQFMKAVTF